MVGRGESEIMTFNEKRRWVFPLFPTSGAYKKLDGYFGKLRKWEIEALQVQGGFGAHLEVRKAGKNQKSTLRGEMEKSKAIFRTREIQFGILLWGLRMLLQEARCQN